MSKTTRLKLDLVDAADLGATWCLRAYSECVWPPLPLAAELFIGGV
eukprot:CAMPEP_0169182850 /NCGR_PEP_ID=MMETSP1016-20121227/301_1 /TAXON_ID=342587 /ORGANISM="Karlodinium micrum, Strain CCMP2283" /LENGTH=45 /DNA_ID= /DNA_START= /DNA_END= /DNA_ORIENTATION=